VGAPTAGTEAWGGTGDAKKSPPLLLDSLLRKRQKRRMNLENSPDTIGTVVPSTGKPPKHHASFYVGKKYGMLLVTGTTKNRRDVVTLCDCGGTRVVGIAPIRRGVIFSCGCAPRRVKRDPKGFTANKRTFYSWQDMRRRCYDPKRTHDYPHYGGRGITVCDRWVDCFANFLDDMGTKPDGYSLERKDVNLPYCPENCMWLPKPLQMNNTRRTRHIVLRGDTLCAKDACRRTGICYSTWRKYALQKGNQASFDFLLAKREGFPLPKPSPHILRP
jgi:hypothetical protein